MSVKEIAESCGVADKLMTTKELAKVLNVDVRTIQMTVKRILDPAKVHSRVINGGKSMVFNEEQATLIKQEIQKHHNLATRQIDEVSTHLEVLERAGNALKDLMTVIADMKAEADIAKGQVVAISAENKMLKHQIEYNEVIGCARWTDVKKLLNIKVKWDIVCTALSLEENVDYYKKCMGYDNYPTVLLPDNTVNRIKECISSIEQENRK